MFSKKKSIRTLFIQSLSKSARTIGVYFIIKVNIATGKTLNLAFNESIEIIIIFIRGFRLPVWIKYYNLRYWHSGPDTHHLGLNFWIFAQKLYQLYLNAFLDIVHVVRWNEIWSSTGRNIIIIPITFVIVSKRNHIK